MIPCNFVISCINYGKGHGADFFDNNINKRLWWLILKSGSRSGYITINDNHLRPPQLSDVVLFIVYRITIFVTPLIKLYPHIDVAAGIDWVGVESRQGTQERYNSGWQIRIKNQYQKLQHVWINFMIKTMAAASRT